MRFLYTALFLTLCAFLVRAQVSLTSRIIVLGNAYDAVKNGRHFLDIVRESVPFDSNTIVLYLGNNVRSASDTAALHEEAAIIDGSAATAIFVPGYQDWAEGGRGGYKAVLAQQAYLKGLHNKQIKSYPSDGCPGPKKVELGKGAVMYIMDSQWWLH